MKKELTKIICERCGAERVMDARKVLFLRKSAPYPRDWRKIWKNLRICPNCGADWEETWNKYLSGGVVKETTKVLSLKH